CDLKPVVGRTYERHDFEEAPMAPNRRETIKFGWCVVCHVSTPRACAHAPAVTPRRSSGTIAEAPAPKDATTSSPHERPHARERAHVRHRGAARALHRG